MGWRGRIIRLSAFMIILGLALLAGALLGHRSGMIDFMQAFGAMGVAALVAGAAAFLSLITIVWTLLSNNRGGLVMAIAVFIVSIATFGIPAYQAQVAFSGTYPPIHDITTDLEDPPVFVDIAKMRGDDTNSIDYAAKSIPQDSRFGALSGQDYKPVQKQYYPGVRSLELDLAPDEAYWLALEVAVRRKWDVVAQVPEEGRIEATVTSKWMGFKDDVVIRLKPRGESGDKSVVDMRSSSRVGVSDIGANAKRIKSFLKELKRRADTVEGSVVKG